MTDWKPLWIVVKGDKKEYQEKEGQEQREITLTFIDYISTVHLQPGIFLAKANFQHIIYKMFTNIECV